MSPRLQKRFVAPLVLLALLAAAIIAFRALGLEDYFTRENIAQLRASIESLGAWGPALFILICIIGSLLFSPAMPMLLVAGVFGVFWGSVYCTVGLMLGAVASFFLARYTLRPFVEAVVANNPAFHRIDEGVRREGWRMLMFTRLVPFLPFSVQNFAYGLTGIGFPVFFLVTVLCIEPSVIAYAFLGGSIISGEGDLKKTLAYMLVGGMLLVLLSFVPALVRRWERKRAPDLAEPIP